MNIRMGLIIRNLFTNAACVIDCFHAQTLALDTLQEIRIKHCQRALDTQNDMVENPKNKNLKYSPELLSNRDTIKKLVTRNRYLLYKSNNKWIQNKEQRTNILF